MAHPVTELDDVVHQRTRLGILTILQEAGASDFGALRDQLAVTDGNLSQHIRVLEEGGHITVEKTFVGRRPRTTLRVTKQGSRALVKEMDVLKQLVAGGTVSASTTKAAPPRKRAAGAAKARTAS